MAVASPDIQVLTQDAEAQAKTLQETIESTRPRRTQTLGRRRFVPTAKKVLRHLLFAGLTMINPVNPNNAIDDITQIIPTPANHPSPAPENPQATSEAVFMINKDEEKSKKLKEVHTQKKHIPDESSARRVVLTNPGPKDLA